MEFSPLGSGGEQSEQPSDGRFAKLLAGVDRVFDRMVGPLSGVDTSGHYSDRFGQDGAMDSLVYQVQQQGISGLEIPGLNEPGRY